MKEAVVLMFAVGAAWGFARFLADTINGIIWIYFRWVVKGEK